MSAELIQAVTEGGATAVALFALGVVAWVLVKQSERRKDAREDSQPQPDKPGHKCGFNGVQQKTLEDTRDIALDHLKESRLNTDVTRSMNEKLQRALELQVEQNKLLQEFRGPGRFWRDPPRDGE